MNESKDIPQVFQDQQIDLVNLLRPIFKNWRLLAKSAAAFGIVGIFISLLIPNSFTAKTTFILQTGSESSNSGGLSSLASLAGLNLGSVSNGSDIPPSLYPKIVSSVPFKLELLDQDIIVNEELKKIGNYISSKEGGFSILNFITKYTIGLPSVILSTFRVDSEAITFQKSDIFQVNNEDRKLFQALENNLVLSPNKKEGFITLEFSDQNKFIAAQVVEHAKEILQARIIEFKNQSARENLKFTSRQFEQNRIVYERLQDSLAIFRDQNLNISSSLYQNRLDRLERDLNLASSVAEQLASQVEQAKLQLNRDTPVFTIIEPVTVPYQRTSPKRSLIVVSLAFLGFFLSGVFIIVKKPVSQFWKSLKTDKE